MAAKVRFAINDLFCETGADFSDCERYRYNLFRRWDKKKPLMTCCLLNPSSANAFQNDPTVERCQRRAYQSGFGGVCIVNIFAWRSTDPFMLYDVEDPIGPQNDYWIGRAAKESGLFIFGFGGFGLHLNRGKEVIEMVRNLGVIPHALKINKDGTPQHPLYIAYSKQPFPIP